MRRYTPSHRSRCDKHRVGTWPTWGSSCSPCIGSPGCTWQESRPSAVWSSIRPSFEKCKMRGSLAMGEMSSVGRLDSWRHPDMMNCIEGRRGGGNAEAGGGAGEAMFREGAFRLPGPLSRLCSQTEATSTSAVIGPDVLKE